MIQNLLYALILLAGFPVGWYLSKICRDEIKGWKSRLFGIVIVCFILVVGISFISFEYKLPVIISMFFIIIMFLEIIWMSGR